MKRIEQCVQMFRNAIRPPSKLTLSEWADKYAVLSAESSAEAGRWRTLPYQKGIMDAITDPTIERVSVKKSARVGYTKILNHALAYYIHQDPCSMMVVQPTEVDAEGYSKEEIAPMLRDTPVLRGLVTDSKQRDGSNSILHKIFPGGQLSLVGAESPRGFRRVSRRVIAFDETSAYKVSSGKEGSPIKLGIKRTEYFWNRKIIDGSTPGIDGVCAITTAFAEGDQRRRFVPCPQCNHMQYLKFENLKYSKENPMDAYFRCEENACVIEHKDYRWMDENGEWRSTAVAKNPRHVSFHIWAAYSYSPNSTWGHIAAEYESCKDDVEALKTFEMTVKGETWKQTGEAPEHMRLYERREHYPINTCPKGVLFLTAGCDVQKDRLEVEIVGWGRGKESWSIDFRQIMGETHTQTPWLELDKLLNETWILSNGSEAKIRVLAVDSGFNTQHVYNWTRRYPKNRVIPVKGSEKIDNILGTGKDADVSHTGKKVKNAVKVWSVGVSQLKSELYGWLALNGAGDDGKYPPGFCHFPQYEVEHFKRLASEELREEKVNGRTQYFWHKKYERNEQLDCRNYARAAANFLGMDRFKESHWLQLEAQAAEPEIVLETTPEPTKPAEQPKPFVSTSRPKTNPFLSPGRKPFWGRR